MAQVPGRKKASDQKHASDEHGGVTCQPCDGDGIQVPAKSYCEDCKEFLCETCGNDHKKFKALSHHNLTGVSEIPNVTKKEQGSKPTINCHVHTDKLIEYFCQTHGQLLCATCAVTEHMDCKPEYIPDISLDFLNSGKFKKMKAKLQLMLNNVRLSTRLTEDNIKMTEVQRDQLIAELEQFKEELVKYINEMVNELKAEAEYLYKKELQKLQQVKDDLDNYKRELQDTENYLKKLEENSSDLFIACQARIKWLQELQDQVNGIDAENNVQTYYFERANDSRKLLSTEMAIGMLKEGQMHDTKLEQLSVEQADNRADHTASLVIWEKRLEMTSSEVGVYYSHDNSQCNITGMALTKSNFLLLSDYSNICIKMTDTKTGKIIEYLPLADKPWDITILAEDQAAVTLPWKQKIQFISTQGKLSLLQDIEVNGQCRGICSTLRGYLVVSYDHPPKVDVLDDHGIVLSNIRTDSLGKELFVGPYYVCVDIENSQDVIYVSDCNTNTFIKLTSSGDVLFAYNEKDLREPYGLTLADGHLLICGGESHNIRDINTSGKKIRTLLGKRHGLRYPQCVCYNSQSKAVYVSCYNSNTIKAYQLQ